PEPRRPEVTRDSGNRVSSLERDRPLKVMPGDRLVKRQRLEISPRLVRRVVGAEEVDPGPAAVLGRRIPFAHALALAKRRLRIDYDVGPGKASEPGGHRGLGAEHRAPRRVQHRAARAERESRGGPQPPEL